MKRRVLKLEKAKSNTTKCSWSRREKSITYIEDTQSFEVQKINYKIN